MPFSLNQESQVNCLPHRMDLNSNYVTVPSHHKSLSFPLSTEGVALVVTVVDGDCFVVTVLLSPSFIDDEEDDDLTPLMGSTDLIEMSSSRLICRQINKNVTQNKTKQKQSQIIFHLIFLFLFLFSAYLPVFVLPLYLVIQLTEHGSDILLERLVDSDVIH